MSEMVASMTLLLPDRAASFEFRGFRADPDAFSTPLDEIRAATNAVAFTIGHRSETWPSKRIGQESLQWHLLLSAVAQRLATARPATARLTRI
jgi:hypothetical protein